MSKDRYVRYEEFSEVKQDVKEIKDNHLPSILKKVGCLDRKVKSLKKSVVAIGGDVKTLRWYIIAASSVLGIVLAILKVFD